MDNLNRIVIMCKDGRHYYTDIKGWHGETLALKLVDDAKADFNILLVVWYEGKDENELEVRAQHYFC